MRRKGIKKESVSSLIFKGEKNTPYKETPELDFAAVSIHLASPATIRSWSSGEVKRAETINYRSFRPERDGIFCERIFGPTRDYECFCGKYKNIKYKGVICDRCGVEVTTSSVRRYRMGHIELVCPVAHIWYVRRIPSFIGILLDMTNKALERVIYYESWLVVHPGDSPFDRFQLISDREYMEWKDKAGPLFKAGIGAEIIRELLQELNLEEMAQKLQREIKEETSIFIKKKKVRKLETVWKFLKSGNRPEWMILTVIPVIPPDLRPIVQLDGGKFATADLNDLYRRLINRNNRLKRLMSLRAPQIILRNEKRMLQEAADALFDNSKKEKPVRGTGNRPLRSLSDLLRGKQGRFRQNLLGKRVDYSGRAVIVVGPELKLHQCGVPKKMALELFKPFVMRKLISEGLVSNMKTAKRIIEEDNKEVWDILEEIIKDHPVFLNRAPTLHRLSIQAFEPVLIEENAIRIPSPVCAAFNADFDGDQMAIHVPLSTEAQVESKLLMLSSYNILSPANGRAIVTPTQDMVLGLHYLTKERLKQTGEIEQFANMEEAELAYDLGVVDLNTLIKIKHNGKVLITTVGRIKFNKALPEGIEFINRTMEKNFLNDLMQQVYLKYGPLVAAQTMDNLKELGFKYATYYAPTLCLEDMIIPKVKEKEIQRCKKEVDKIMELYHQGIIAEEERYNRIIDLWAATTENLSEILFEELSKDRDGWNPIYTMMDSGARGTRLQVKQLAAMRGLIARPSGEIIELPIISNFREGLSMLEYFISTHGARKGLADTALKTADAGYLTRRLVDVTQEIIVKAYDCGTVNGLEVAAIEEGDEIIESLRDRITGRVALEEIINPLTGEIIVEANSLIDHEKAKKIEEAEIEKVKIRSVLTCEIEKGVCALCYGSDPSMGKLVNIGEAVGIIAAQSIGEPGTQLTMRTFHIGGTAFMRVEERRIKLPYSVEIVELPKRRVVGEDKVSILLKRGEIIYVQILEEHILPRSVKLRIFDGLWMNIGDIIGEEEKDGRKVFIKTKVAGVIKIRQEMPNYIIHVVGKEKKVVVRAGTKIFVEEGDILKPNQLIAEVDPYNELIVVETGGEVKLKDVVIDRTLKEEYDEVSGRYTRVIVEDPEKELLPTVVIRTEDGREVNYSIPYGARLTVEDGQRIEAGSVIGKFPQELTRTKDITGGLPRVIELLEARRPKNPATIAEISGIVSIKEGKGGVRIVTIEDPTTKVTKEYTIPAGKYLKVHDKDFITAGTPITEGAIDPHYVLAIKGEKALQEFLLTEVQQIYRFQGVQINDKHFEIVIKQMLRKVKITDVGDTDFLLGEEVEKYVFKKVNEEVIKAGGKPAIAKPLLLGITKASLSTESFIAAASFQETTRILTDAAVEGKVDALLGLKENIILGKLIPAGTGMMKHRQLEVKTYPQIEKKDENE